MGTSAHLWSEITEIIMISTEKFSTSMKQTMTGLEVQNSVAGSLFRSGFRSMFHVFDKKYKFFSVTVIRMIDGVVMRIVGKLDAYFYQQP
jgi:hypothetical protein